MASKQKQIPHRRSRKNSCTGVRWEARDRVRDDREKDAAVLRPYKESRKSAPCLRLPAVGRAGRP